MRKTKGPPCETWNPVVFRSRFHAIRTGRQLILLGLTSVGMEAHGTGIGFAYDRVKQALRLETDHGEALREAIMSCRKGGTLSILGVYGLMDKFPIGVIMNKGLTVRTAQQHGQRYMSRLLDYAARGELDPSFLATHWFSLEESPRGYDMFKHKRDGCVRAVFIP